MILIVIIISISIIILQSYKNFIITLDSLS